MKNKIFYDSWLSIGDPAHLLQVDIQTMQIPDTVTSKKQRDIGKAQPGAHCQNVTYLRNGNFLADCSLFSGTGLSLRKVADGETRYIYTCGNLLLVVQDKVWFLFDPVTLTVVQKQYVSNQRSVFSTVNDSFFAIGKSLETFSAHGDRDEQVRIMLSASLNFYEVYKNSTATIITGFQTDTFLPQQMRSFKFLQLVPPQGFSPPDEDTQLREIIHSSIVAFHGESLSRPLFYDKGIVMLTDSMIVEFPWDLSAIRVLEGKFISDYISSGPDTVVYTVCLNAGRPELIGVSFDGELFFRQPLSDKTPVAPPLISTGNNIWDITGNDISVFNHDGSLAWNRDVYLDKRAEINPVLYNNDLVLVNGDKMEFITAEGETAFVYIQAGECFQTPIVYDGKIHYYIGGKNGLYLIESK